MPSKSKKQHNLMALVATNPKKAKQLKIPQSVGKEFLKADKGRKFKEGDTVAVKKLFKGKDTKAEELKEAKAIKAGKITPEQYASGEAMEVSKKPKMKKGGKITKKRYC